MFGTTPLSKENILKIITPYDIFKKYILNFDKVGKLFKSELRNDSNPTCYIIAVKGEELLYRDFAEIGYLNCFDYVMQKYTLTFYQALEMIALDFNLELSFTKTLKHTPTTSIRYNYVVTKEDRIPCRISTIIRNFDERDKKYWYDNYNLNSSILIKYHVYPLEGFFINSAYFHGNTLTYGYFLGYEDITNRELWKIYRPLTTKKDKWFTNANESTIMGYNNISYEKDLLIITKSLKDVMVLNKANFNAISAHAEGILIKEEFITKLKQDFKKIIVIFDNDRAGILNAEKYKERYKLPIYFLPEDTLKTKDVSDYVKNYSYEKLIEFLNNIKEISGRE